LYKVNWINVTYVLSYTLRDLLDLPAFYNFVK
jgi:hypothetical protein